MGYSPSPVDRPALVVDDDAVSRHVLIQTLTSAGMNPIAVPDGERAMEWLEEGRPSVVLLDLVMPGADGFSVLRHIRARPELAEVPVIVLSALDAEEEIQRIFAEGADDYVHKPFRPTELIARLRGQLKLREFVEQLSRRERNAQIVVDLTQTLASSLHIREILFTVVDRLASLVRVDRCSIVLVGEDSNVGFVVASSDDDGLRNLPIQLTNYPEIRQVLETGEALVIHDAPHHPMLETVVHQLPTHRYSSLALVPLLHETTPHGVVFMRAHGDARFDDGDLALVRTVANATSIALSNARVLQSLRDASERSAFARIEAERRVQLFQRYADFFESSADGMMVIDRNGLVLFANPRAREITGFPEIELMGMSVSSLFAPRSQERSMRLLRGFREGIYPRGVDLDTLTKDGPSIILSLSCSSVLHEEDAVLLSFRDVTHERRTAIELEQTKEFLERVIDGSVDAIVSTNMAGKILLFNRAAARMLDRDPGLVVGKLSINELYPPGVSRRVLRRLASPEQGGWGRLENERVEVVSSSGERIPASLSAAFIVEAGHPVAIVGLFTDLRERLRMEQRLHAAQEELRLRERHAIVAELSGAAAHELNQPLTSIIAYAERVRRAQPASEVLQNAANVITTESERMAEIVRRIGRITRYETKSYVGAARILDLEKSSFDDSPEGEKR